jgi:hypothetical protein
VLQRDEGEEGVERLLRRRQKLVPVLRVDAHTG